MPYALSPGVSFCETSGRLVFLDLPGDRYFCLAEPAEAAFRRFARGVTGASAEIGLRALTDSGLLVPAPRMKRPLPTRPPAAATGSLLDAAPRPRADWPIVTRAALATLSTRMSLRWRSLAATLQSIERRRALAGIVTAPDRLQPIAAAFLRLNLLFSPLDQCLPRSIALASLLARNGVAAQLVIGVKLRPFLAHSWVQSGPLLINERLDVVRTFTPILVV
jgi:hypothetical protein